MGRYRLYDKLAAGGMASVHLARIAGDAGFARTVAIKRLHPQFAADPEFATMFIDEARLAARIRHPNVVPTLDVVAEGEELFLVMEYIDGDSLAGLLRNARDLRQPVPVDIAVGIAAGLLHGLHAAHEARNEDGSPLDIVHRDVSPQNVLVGTDGVARVLDFGIAKAIGQSHTTREGTLKGKVPYFAPEQIQGAAPTRQVDVFAAGAVLWEILCGERLFAAENEAATMGRIMSMPIPKPSTRVPTAPPELDAVVTRALERDLNARYATAADFAEALEATKLAASPRKIGEWVRTLAGPRVEARAALVAAIERSASSGPSGSFPASGSFPRVAPAIETSPTEAAITTAAEPPPAASRSVSLGTAIAIVSGASIVLAMLGVGIWVALNRGPASNGRDAIGQPSAAELAPSVPTTIASATSTPQPAASSSASSAPSATAVLPRPTAGPTTVKKPDGGTTKRPSLYGRD